VGISDELEASMVLDVTGAATFKSSSFEDGGMVILSETLQATQMHNNKIIVESFTKTIRTRFTAFRKMLK